MKSPAANKAATGPVSRTFGAALRCEKSYCGTSLSAKWGGRDPSLAVRLSSLATLFGTLGAVASDRHARSPFSFSRPMADLPGAARFLLCRARPTAAAVINLPDDRRRSFSEAAPAPIVENNHYTHLKLSPAPSATAWSAFGVGLLCGLAGYLVGRAHQWVRDTDLFLNGRKP